MKKPKILNIVGPTASGKTSLSISLAQEFDGEIISADSRQVYKTLDIGTGKVTQEEMAGVPHHLLDVADITETYTAADFARDAAVAISEINNRGKLPIIAGGSFFYTDTLLGKISTPKVSPNETLRAELETQSTQELVTKLETLDAARARDIDHHNRRRLIRSIEIATALGSVPPSTPTESPYDVLTLGIMVEKEALRAKFAKRIKQWLAEGFADEVRSLQARGVTEDQFAEFGFEYTLMLAFLRDEFDEATLIEKFVQKNWQYAKRQMTWLKRDDSVEWFDLAGTDTAGNRDAISRRVQSFLIT